MKLSVTIEKDKTGEQVVITGDAQGLRSLMEACKAISGKSGPGAHFHFEWQMNNLTKGSVPMTVRFSEG